MAPEHAYLVIATGMLGGGLAWAACMRLYRQQRDWPAVEQGEWRLTGIDPGGALARALLLVAGSTRVRRRGERGLVIALGGCSGRLEFRAADDGTLLSVQLDWARGARMFGFLMGLLVLVIQPAVILGIGGGLWHWVASDPDGGVRSSAWQVVQVAHVLWPPFLVYLLHRHLRRQARAVIEQLVSDLGEAAGAAPGHA